VKTFPIKKRINAELFIYMKQGLFIQKGDKERMKKIMNLLEEGRTETAGKENAVMKSMQPVWNDLHYTDGKTN